MGMGYTPGAQRPDLNERMEEDGRHERDRVYAQGESLANEVKPSWWVRLKRMFSRRQSPTE
jgi:hypothetical protein